MRRLAKLCCAITLVIALLLVGFCFWAIIVNAPYISHYQEGYDCALINCTIKDEHLYRNWLLIPENYFFEKEVSYCQDNCETLMPFHCETPFLSNCCYFDNNLSSISTNCNDDENENPGKNIIDIFIVGIIFLIFAVVGISIIGTFLICQFC